MGGVNLDAVAAGLLGQPCGIGKPAYDVVDILLGHLLGHGAIGAFDRRRSPGGFAALVGCIGRGTGMVQLDKDLGVIFMDHSGELFKGHALIVILQNHFGWIAASGFGIYQNDAGHYNAGAALCALFQIVEELLTNASGGIAPSETGGGYYHAVLNIQPTDFTRFKKLWIFHPQFLLTSSGG